ncbi:hypothetical protein L1987_72426 [Smallanthus sonchifolius]|uniref:Uncharacterized protein n=1 Tax=Smallanthus sonchifolius TaxID=185202 RepID=A0ACB9AV73_9ASTR|nr:hypothetical protein L1987_72426 [Smallanthus sonchifolius]
MLCCHLLLYILLKPVILLSRRFKTISILFDYGRERNSYSASEYGDVAISTGPNARDADNAIPHGGSGAAGKSEVLHM